MKGDRVAGIGHNQPPESIEPAPAPIEPLELRPTRGISCDWYETRAGGERRPRHFVRYWRIYRDGKMIDSFLTKARAMRALRQLRQREVSE